MARAYRERQGQRAAGAHPGDRDGRDRRRRRLDRARRRACSASPSARTAPAPTPGPRATAAAASEADGDRRRPGARPDRPAAVRRRRLRARSRRRASARWRRDVGEPLRLEAPWHAAGVSEIVEENMANAARVHAIERGQVIGRYTMIAFGGGAPLHAGRLAEKLGVRRVVVPERRERRLGDRLPARAGVVRGRARAIAPRCRGSTPARSTRSSTRAPPRPRDVVRRAVRGRRARRPARGRRALHRPGPRAASSPLPEGALGADGRAAPARAVRGAVRARSTASRCPDQDVEFVTWSVTARGAVRRARAPPRQVARRSPRRRRARGAASTSRRSAAWPTSRCTGATTSPPGGELAGPALIEEAQTTTVVPASFRPAWTALAISSWSSRPPKERRDE